MVEIHLDYNNNIIIYTHTDIIWIQTPQKWPFFPRIVCRGAKTSKEHHHPVRVFLGRTLAISLNERARGLAFPLQRDYLYIILYVLYFFYNVGHNNDNIIIYCILLCRCEIGRQIGHNIINTHIRAPRVNIIMYLYTYISYYVLYIKYNSHACSSEFYKISDVFKSNVFHRSTVIINYNNIIS